MNMAQKRPKERDFSNVKTFNLFSAFGEDGKIRSACRPAFQDMISDEEEDIEELKAKLQNSPSKARKGKGKSRRKRTYSDSDDDDGNVISEEKSARSRDSPSPPPSPEFDEDIVEEILQKNREAAQLIQSVEMTVNACQMARARSEVMDAISPVMVSPTKAPGIQDRPSVRNSITVKVRSRSGLLRFRDYPMDATFDGILMELGQKEAVESSRIRLTRKGDDIMETDTPRSVQLHIADILEYVVVEGGGPAILSTSLLDEEDLVFIRLRTSQRNSEMTRRLAKMEPLLKLFQEYAEAQDKPLEECRFVFDGSRISGKDTPEDLDMDEENVIDVEILS